MRCLIALVWPVWIVGALAAAQPGCHPTPPPAGPRLQLDLPLVDVPGRRYSLSETRGRVTILTFVASWCVPCQLVLRRMLEVRALYGRKIALAAVATDRRVRFARQFKRDLHLPFPVLLGNRETMRKAGLPPVPVVPLTYILDRKGRIRYAHKGLVTTRVLAQETGRVLDLDR